MVDLKQVPKRVAFSIVAIGIASAITGCTTPLPLDDVRASSVALATVEDVARAAQAEADLSRRLFTGATINELLTGVRSQSDLPDLKITFHTQRMLAGHSADTNLKVARGSAYFCNVEPEPRNWLDSADVMWRGRIVTSRIVQDIQAALNVEGQPQEYEIIVRYTNWDRGSRRPDVDTVTLMPPSDDLCFALVSQNYPLPTTAGHPLRIEKAAIEAVLGPLPRAISFGGR